MTNKALVMMARIVEEKKDMAPKIEIRNEFFGRFSWIKRCGIGRFRYVCVECDAETNKCACNSC